jgi:hypothetical protein
MKIAFCISGVPHLDHECAKFIKSFSEYFSTYTFVHYWSVDNQNTIQHHSWSGRDCVPLDHDLYRKNSYQAFFNTERFDEKVNEF